MNEKKYGENSKTDSQSERTTDSQQSQTSVPKKEYNKDFGKNISMEELLGDREDYGTDIEKIPITGTPFHIVRIDNNKDDAFIAIGDARITERGNEEELAEQIAAKDWKLIVSTIILITERVMKGIQMEDKARNEITPEMSKQLKVDFDKYYQNPGGKEEVEEK